MKLIRNVSWIFGANLFASLSKWLILVIIARLLTPNDVGVYSLAFAIGAPITLFANMKLRSLFITEEKFDFYDYVYSRNTLSIVAFVVLVLIALFIYPSHFFPIVIVGLIKILDLQSELYYAQPHKKGDMDFIGKVTLLKFAIILFVFFIILFITKDLVTTLLSQLLVQLIFFWFIEKKNIIEKYQVRKGKLNVKNVKLVLVIGLPLGFVQMMYSFNSFYPRYLLEYYESAEILGYFSAITYIVIIGNMMMNAVSQNFLPILVKRIKLKDYNSFNKDLFIKLTLFSIGLGVILIIFSYVFGDIFLKVVYGLEYVAYVDVLILMSIALAINFVSWNFDTALMAMNYISIQPKISAIMIVINIVIGFILVRNYSILGAAYTIIITNTIQLILRVYFVKTKVYFLENTNN
jgi:O-antigen/teichoic acid export membrane protein